MTDEVKKKPSDVRTNSKLLMIEITDSNRTRQFFTPKKNLQYLIEFSRIYNARLVEVRVTKVEALTLGALVDAINNPDFQQKGSFKELNDLTPMKLPFCQSTAIQPTIASETTEHGKIQSEIRCILLKGDTISTKCLAQRFASKKLSDSTIRRYFRLVRSVLEDEGYTLKKKQGKYWQCTINP